VVRSPGVSILSALLLTLVVASANAQVPGGPAHPISPVPFPTGGGHYGGPGDTVPPGSGGGPGCNGIICPPAPISCGTFVCSANWVPHPVLACYACACDAQPHPVQAWDLTFDGLNALINNPACGGTGEITVTKTVSDVCDVTGILSNWLIAGSYTPMPINGTVPVLVCVDGQPLTNPGGQATALGVNCAAVKSSNCLNCNPPGTHVISVTFNRVCMARALNAWQTALGSSYDGSKWLIHIAATGCVSCN
jgi:hypothetical protein